jgi:hypothetical protein
MFALCRRYSHRRLGVFFDKLLSLRLYFEGQKLSIHGDSFGICIGISNIGLVTI